MNNTKLLSYNAIIKFNEESYFKCLLNNKKNFEISFWSFYEFVGNTDEELKRFSLTFDSWEDLTDELVSLGYDFDNKLNEYLQQFTDDEIVDFSF